MRKVTAQFKIEGELLTANGDLYTNDEISDLVVQRLKNRSADFDKLVEDDGDDNIETQLHDQDLILGEDQATTLVAVTLTVNNDAVATLEIDHDLIYLKAITEIESGKLKISRDETQDNVSHLTFE